MLSHQEMELMALGASTNRTWQKWHHLASKQTLRRPGSCFFLHLRALSCYVRSPRSFLEREAWGGSSWGESPHRGAPRCPHNRPQLQLPSDCNCRRNPRPARKALTNPGNQEITANRCCLNCWVCLGVGAGWDRLVLWQQVMKQHPCAIPPGQGKVYRRAAATLRVYWGGFMSTWTGRDFT